MHENHASNHLGGTGWLGCQKSPAGDHQFDPPANELDARDHTLKATVAGIIGLFFLAQDRLRTDRCRFESRGARRGRISYAPAREWGLVRGQRSRRDVTKSQYKHTEVFHGALVFPISLDLTGTIAKARQGIEGRIAKLAKASAAGIHLILAMQQPSRRVVSGTIDANMSARVALKTSSAVESCAILRRSGAEELLGHGDLSFKDVGEPMRLQSSPISPEDRQRLSGA